MEEQRSQTTWNNAKINDVNGNIIDGEMTAQEGTEEKNRFDDKWVGWLEQETTELVLIKNNSTECIIDCAQIYS